jgi:hypothetical protein
MLMDWEIEGKIKINSCMYDIDLDAKNHINERPWLRKLAK